VVEVEKLEWTKDIEEMKKTLKAREQLEARFDWEGILLPFEDTSGINKDSRNLFLHGEEPNRPDSPCKSCPAWPDPICSSSAPLRSLLSPVFWTTITLKEKIGNIYKSCIKINKPSMLIFNQQMARFVNTTNFQKGFIESFRKMD
jgi:hypothetical protein